MNLKQMAAFKELMLTGSVSEAARNLNRTQPSISHMIQTLEDQIGMQLFQRKKGRLHPVPEAHYLFEECNELLRHVDTVRETMSRMKAMQAGELRIACNPGPSVFFMPNLVSRHLGESADVKTTILSRSTPAVHQLVSAQQFDLGFADYDPARQLDGSLLSQDGFTFDCVCAIPKDDPLCEKEVIDLADLAEKPIASLYAEHVIYGRSERLFASQGLPWAPRFEGLFFIQLLTFVEQGLARAIVDPLSVASFHHYSGGSDRIAFRPMSTPVEFGFAILTPGFRPPSVIASSFTKFLGDELVRLGARRVENDQAASA